MFAENQIGKCQTITGGRCLDYGKFAQEKLLRKHYKRIIIIITI